MTHKHKWTRPLAVVGGCKENPGCFSKPGGAFLFVSVCRRCGMYKDIYLPGPGEWWGPRLTRAEWRITYRPPDQKSVAWIERS